MIRLRSLSAGAKLLRPGCLRKEKLCHPQADRQYRVPQLWGAVRHLRCLSSRTRSLIACWRTRSERYPDLTTHIALALVHQRFSTNTFPDLDLGFHLPHDRPQRRSPPCAVTHQLDGRRKRPWPAILGADLDKIWPLIPEGQSDSACFDNALELLVAGGIPVPRHDGAGFPKPGRATTTWMSSVARSMSITPP